MDELLLQARNESKCEGARVAPLKQLTGRVISYTGNEPWPLTKNAKIKCKMAICPTTLNLKGMQMNLSHVI